MKKTIRLTESELTNLVKRIINEDAGKTVSMESLHEYMHNEYNQKNNKGVKLEFTFDGTNMVVNFNGAKMVVEKCW
jgi:isopropylmalate/homocitrate/citramalate synthase